MFNYMTFRIYLDGSRNCKINDRRIWKFSGLENAFEKCYCSNFD